MSRNIKNFRDWEDLTEDDWDEMEESYEPKQKSKKKRKLDDEIVDDAKKSIREKYDRSKRSAY